MLAKSAKIILGFIGVAGDIWSIVRWADKSGYTAMMKLGPPEYAAMLTIFTGLVLWAMFDQIASFFRYLFYRFSKRGQFISLQGEIEELERVFGAVRGSDLRRRDNVNALKVLYWKLAQLGISIPVASTNANSETWLHHLSYYAKRGHLKDARKYSKGGIGRLMADPISPRDMRMANEVREPHPPFGPAPLYVSPIFRPNTHRASGILCYSGAPTDRPPAAF